MTTDATSARLGLAPGPHRTVTSTSPVPDGGIRRTTSADVRRPGGPAGPVVVDLRGRDVRVAADGVAEVLDEIELTLDVDGNSVITAADVHGGRTTPPDLVGLALLGGWGRALAERTSGERTLLHSALEDLGGAFLVSGYAPLRAGLLGLSPEDTVAAAERQADVCAGWAAGGDLHGVLVATGRHAVPIGPDASPEVVSGDAWHPVADLTPHGVRRIRRLDVVPTADGLDVSAHFRDSYAPAHVPDEPEMVMHEYLVAATVDRDGHIAAIDVDARVLPWQACPGAVASAQRVVGTNTADLVAAARRDLRGPSTCTHLTSTVRSLADVAHLADRLAAGS